MTWLAAADPSAPALVWEGHGLSYGELRERIHAGSGALGGRRWIPLAPRRTAEDLVGLLSAVEAGVPVLLHGPGSTEEERRAHGASVDAHSWPADPGERPLAFVATSGSTGAPKLAELSHRAWRAHVAASAAHLGWHHGDRWLLAFSPARVGGLSILLRTLSAGCAVVVAPEGPFTAETFFRMVGEHRVTLASLVPTMLHRLVETGVRAPACLRAVLVGGAAADPALLGRARELGYPVLATYGMTETCSQVATERPASAGAGAFALPGIGLRADGDRLAVRGDVLFSGYVGGPRIGPDTWWSTGDLGHVAADGRVVVRGRADDVIITGGEKVDPSRLEATVRSCPGVRDAAVFGVPDPEWGEVVALVVEGDIGRDDLSTHLDAALAAGRLTRRDVPRRWAHVASVGAALEDAHVDGPTGKRTGRALRRAFGGAVGPWPPP